MHARTAADDQLQATEAARPGAGRRSQTLEEFLLCELRANLLGLSPRQRKPTSKMRPPTGEPDAGNPPVRFGGRGEVSIPRSYPYRSRGNPNSWTLSIALGAQRRT